MSDWRIDVTNEWQSRDPFGRIKSTDATEASFDIGDASGVRLTAARNGYASFRLQVAGGDGRTAGDGRRARGGHQRRRRGAGRSQLLRPPVDG